MAKRSVDASDSEWVEQVESQFDTQQVFEINLPKSETQEIVLLKDMILKLRGAVSGNEYVFHGAGDKQPVDERDVPAMLAKTSGRPCCGPTSAKYFTLV